MIDCVSAPSRTFSYYRSAESALNPNSEKATTRKEAVTVGGTLLVDGEIATLRSVLREHVNALAVDIGPHTPSNPDSLVRTPNATKNGLLRDAGCPNPPA